MLMVKALVWDFDGLIMDSEDADCSAWREEFEAAGVAITVAEYADWWLRWALRRQVPMLDRLVERAGRGIDTQAVSRRRQARYYQLCADLPARPGVVAWLERAQVLGLQCALAANDGTGRVLAHLDRLGLTSGFEVVVTAHRMAPKPAPDLYLTALERLGVAAGEVVAIEDSPHGVAAAKAAGLWVVAVPNQVSATLDLTAADVIVANLHTVSLEEVLAALPPSAAR